MKTTLSVLLLLAASLPSRPATAFYCANRIVSIGDTDYEVRTKCGPPAHRERFQMTDWTGSGEISSWRERWTYDFGPSKLIRFLTFDSGRLRRIETGPYGIRGQAQDLHCRVSRGWNAYLVLGVCGQPASRERRVETYVVDQQTGRVAHSVVDEWIYDFGPNRLLRVFTFRNGRLVDDRTRGYGYGGS